MRQEMKEKEMKEDLDYMNAYAEMLEKQEQARKEQMEKLKKIQVHFLGLMLFYVFCTVMDSASLLLYFR